MKIQGKTIRDAIFIITEEQACPIYNVGEELKVEGLCFSPPACKPGCLILAKELIQVVTSGESLGQLSHLGRQKSRFTCGGCDGRIHFEFKKEKEFSTLQMKLLDEAQERRQQKHLEKFFGVLRSLDIFSSLDNDALTDLTLLLELQAFPVETVVAKKGDPARHLYLILSGQVALRDEEGIKISELRPGEIFCELNLLSGEPLSNTFHTEQATQVAMLSIKNFKHVLSKFPVLQLFLFRLLVDRAQAMTIQSGEITSGMTGALVDVPTVDLFQLINSSQKTGTVLFTMDEGKAAVFFQEGEVVHARYLKLEKQEAFFALLGLNSGHFRYTQGIPSYLETAPPLGDFMALFLEGLQRIDESDE